MRGICIEAMGACSTRKQIYVYSFTPLPPPLYLSLPQIPTGEVTPVAGTGFDFTKPRPVGEALLSIDGCGKPGYDHCYARAAKGAVPAGGLGFAPIAVLTHPKSGRTMTVSTDAPGVQL